MQGPGRMAVVVGNGVTWAAPGACYARMLDHLPVPIGRVLGAALSSAEKVATIRLPVGPACTACSSSTGS